mgnify:CR=1 FL=1
MRSIAAMRAGNMPTENGSGKERLTIRRGFAGWVASGIGCGVGGGRSIKQPPRRATSRKRSLLLSGGHFNPLEMEEIGSTGSQHHRREVQ